MPEPHDTDVPVITNVALTDAERRRAARAVEFIANVLGADGSTPVQEHMDLAQRLMPEGEILA